MASITDRAKYSADLISTPIETVLNTCSGRTGHCNYGQANTQSAIHTLNRNRRRERLWINNDSCRQRRYTSDRIGNSKSI